MDHSNAELPAKIITAIDVGTNSAHMVVAEMDHVGEMRVLDTDKVNLRLGQAIDSDGNMTEDGIRRTVEALSHMKAISSSYASTTRAVATHATREAKNHKKLLQAVKQATGITIELIDGIEEARLEFLGMRYGLALHGQHCLGLDIGGGSTEIIIAQDDDMHFATSLKLGAVTLTERFLSTKAVGPFKPKDLTEYVHARLAHLPADTKRHKYSKAIASSGTAKALAYMHSKQKTGITISDPNGYVMPAKDLLDMTEKMLKLQTPAKIRELFDVDQARSEIILAGAVIFREVTAMLDVKEWVITSYGLREGLVADTFYRTFGRRSDDLPDVPDIQWHSVLQFARRLRLNEPHARQVKRLALRIHDQLAPLLRPEDSEDQRDINRKVLKGAAYLREAGKFICASQYHKHSCYLISNSRLPGFTEPERLMMGLIARFQRKGLPSESSEACEDLLPPDIKRLRFLSGIVRLAAALDRARQNRVADVIIGFSGGQATFTILHDKQQAPDVELHKAGLELEALEKSFGVKIQLMAQIRKKPE